MHTEFQFKIDFHVKDWDTRVTFIRAMREAMQLLYTQAAMLSEETPSVHFTVTDGKRGIRKLSVFNKEANNVTR